jgi:hypothetical protein
MKGKAATDNEAEQHKLAVKKEEKKLWITNKLEVHHKRMLENTIETP